jgi:outer membrane receptor for ferrienterochelin and colicins
VPVLPVPYAASANVLDSVATGLELQLKGRFLTDWRWGLGYTPEIVTDYFYAGQNETTSLTNFASGTPVHTVNANLGWSHGRWEVDAFLRYKSRFWGYPVVPLGAPRTMAVIIDYVSVDARVGYRLTDNVTLAVSAQNVMQATQQQTAGPPVERRVFGTISAKF